MYLNLKTILCKLYVLKVLLLLTYLKFQKLKRLDDKYGITTCVITEKI